MLIKTKLLHLENKCVCINLEWFCDTKGNLFNSKTPWNKSINNMYIVIQSNLNHTDLDYPGRFFFFIIRFFHYLDFFVIRIFPVSQCSLYLDFSILVIFPFCKKSLHQQDVTYNVGRFLFR